MRRRISNKGLLLAAAAAVLVFSIALENGARGDEGPPALSITVQGGVSLGAYEAGYLYYLTEVLKLNEQAEMVKVVTGASAGTINALLVVEALRRRRPTPDPTSSLLYRVWTDDRLASRRLLDVTSNPDAVEPGTLSSGKSLAGIVQMVKDEWTRREPSSSEPPRSLDIILGATVTRLKARETRKQPNFTVPRQEEKLSVRIRHEEGAFLVENYIHGRPGYEQALLPTDSNGLVDFDRMEELLLASSAFPFAFSPVPMSLCMRKHDGPLSPFCKNDDPSLELDVLFLDGGVFDNNPLRLAYQIIESDITSGTYRDADSESLETLRPEAFSFLFLDPNNTSYPSLSSHETDCDEAMSFCGVEQRICEKLRGVRPSGQRGFRETDYACEAASRTCERKNEICKDAVKNRRREARRGSKYNLFAEAGGFFGDFMGTSMGKELAVLDEEHPDVLSADRLSVTTRDYPTASGHLANFFGFFDTKLLKYDFYLGMHDARSFVEASASMEGGFLSGVAVSYPEEELLGPATAASWQPFRCMRAVFDGVGDSLEQCPPETAVKEVTVGRSRGGEVTKLGAKPIPMQDLVILMQSSLDQLYSHCRFTRPGASNIHPHCDRARQGASPPFLLGLKPWGTDEEAHEKNWRKRYGESDFRYMLRLLELYRFHFFDLGLKRNASTNAMFQIRKDMISYVDAYSSDLPFGQKLLSLTTAKPALNFAFKYAPRPHIVYFTLGKGGEVGWSGTPSLPRSLGLGIRLNAALQAQGLSTLIPPKDVTVAVSPVLGPELEVLHPGSAWVQTRLGVRGGFQFNFRTIDESSCADESRTEQCNAFVTQGFLAATLLEHLRLQVVGEWLAPGWPSNAPKADDFWNLLVSLGWQI